MSTVSPTASTPPRCTPRATAAAAPAPTACEITGSRAKSTPIPKTAMPKKYKFPMATAARSVGVRRPTITVSIAPMAIIPT